ncbi:MAG: class I SAM-dependent methyltransferase [Methanococcoides sp.]|nr:class I SAM-dependent methyltransferase [Methanococcoides sp.]
MGKKGLNTTKDTLRKYNRYSHVYDLFEWIMEHIAFKKWRKVVFSKVEGRCLEVGLGTGKNFDHYPENAQMVAIDLSPGMMGKAKGRAAKADVEMVVMDAQHLAFKDNAFDSVVMTFVLCSVPDPVRGVEECVRVCKPEGKIINLEHVRSKYRIIAFMEELMNPITSGFFGFNVNRNTRSNIEAGGAIIVEDHKFAFFDVFRLFISKPDK